MSTEELLFRRMKTNIQSVIVMPMHDPTGLYFPHLAAVTPQLKELFAHAVISITPATRQQQAVWVAHCQADTFFSVLMIEPGLAIGAEFVQLYSHAATLCPAGTLVHLCFIDRVAYALQSAYCAEFTADMQALQQADVPLLFQRSAAAWQTHPRNYQAVEAMLTTVGEGYFGRTLDFAWCHLVVEAGQLRAILPQVKRHDLAILAELVLCQIETIHTRDVDWLAWEDPFTLGQAAEQLKTEREQSPAETQKRVNYVLAMLQTMHERIGHQSIGNAKERTNHD